MATDPESVLPSRHRRNPLPKVTGRFGGLSTQGAHICTESGFWGGVAGYPSDMSPFDAFVDEVELSITDAVDSLNPEETARLYADVLDMEQRLEALYDALTLLAAERR